MLSSVAPYLNSSTSSKTSISNCSRMTSKTATSTDKKEQDASIPKMAEKSQRDSEVKNAEKSKKEVTFAQISAKEIAKAKRDHPTKVNMGKASLWQVLGFPLGLLVFALIVCYSIRDIGKPTGEKNQKTVIERLQEAATKRIETKFKQRGMSAPNCSLYHATSSIPGAGYAVYAGKDYNVGDVIVSTVMSK